MKSQNNNTDENISQNYTENNQNEAMKTARRELLRKMAKSAKYAAPATIALMSMEAKACSFSC